MQSHTRFRHELKRFLAAMGIVGVVAGLFGCAQADNTALQLANGSFESWSAGVPTGWNFDAKLRTKGKLAADKKMAKDGASAVQLSPSSQNTPSESPFAIGQLINIASDTGKQLTVSVWLAAEGPATAVVGAFVLDQRGQNLGGEQLRQDASVSGMVHHDTVIGIPSGGVNLVVFCAAEGVAGSTYFDDLRIAVRSANTPQPAASTGAPLRATIHVDASRTLRTIPRTIYGTNIEWAFNANSLWDTDAQRPRVDVVDLMRASKLALIRFPGGVFSDYYHWRDGIGAQSKRPTTLHYPKGPQSRHVLGTDELIDLAQKIDARLLLTVNAGTGTAEEAAEWMRYVKNKAPDRVAAWEIGNELYMKGDASGASLPPSAYADKVKQFARAMRAVDPAAKLGAIGGINQGRYNFISYPDWTRTVLRSAGNDIDFVAVHNAYAPVLVNDERASPDAVYAALMAAPILVGRNLDEVAKAISDNVPERAKAVKIAVTEWGPFFQISPDSAWVDHVKTLGSALYVADMLRVFIEHPQVDIATFFKLVEPTFMGWIGPHDGKYIAKPPLLAFELYSTHFLPELVATETNSPTYDSSAVGVVAAVKNVPYVTAVSSKDAATKRLCMIMVNKHAAAAADVDADVGGVTSLKAGRCHLLTGDSLDAHTGTTLQPIPGFHWARQRPVTGNDFDSPEKANVRIVDQDLAANGVHFQFRIPAHSVACFEFDYE